VRQSGGQDKGKEKDSTGVEGKDGEGGKFELVSIQDTGVGGGSTQRD